MDDHNPAERLNQSMPSLQHLETSLRGKRMLGNLLGVHGPASKHGKQIADGLVRLIEKTTLEYEAARDKFVLYTCGNGEFDHYCRAQDHFESCIQGLHRSICYLDRLRRLGLRQANGLPFVPRPREIEVLGEEVKGRVRKLRDACEHLDKDIIDGKLGEDADVAIHLEWQGIDLTNITISYAELASWIQQIHHFALLLSRVRIVVGEAPEK